MNSDKVTQINKVIRDYFILNKSVKQIPAKDLMSYFIKAGIFPKDNKNGLPIRNVLRQLDKANQLSRIPYVIAERKQVNTNWFFGRLDNANLTNVSASKIPNNPSIATGPKKSRKDSDEHYIIDLCDEVLGLKGSRQHRFPFLKGDAGTMLPVDVYYEPIKLVIEYNEQQHSQVVRFFDKPEKMTVSGVNRGDQRKIYDKRKREILPKHGIIVLDIDYEVFENASGRLLRNLDTDRIIINKMLHKYLTK